MARQPHLNLFIASRGHHEASWRHAEASPLALTDIRYYQVRTAVQKIATVAAG